MNRQQFCEELEIPGSDKTLDVIPIDSSEMHDTFDAAKEYAYRFPVEDWSDKAMLSEIVRIFNTQIEYNIPPQYRKRVRWYINYPDEVTDRSSVMWRYVPDRGFIERTTVCVEDL